MSELSQQPAIPHSYCVGTGCGFADGERTCRARFSKSPRSYARDCVRLAKSLARSLGFARRFWRLGGTEGVSEELREPREGRTISYLYKSARADLRMITT